MRDLAADLLPISQQGDVRDAACQNLFGRIENPILPAFGQNDSLAGGLCLLDELKLESLRSVRW